MLNQSAYEPINPGSTRAGASPLIRMPVIILVVRIFQLLLAVLIFIVCIVLLRMITPGQIIFAAICCILTIAIALYAILTERIQGCRKGYNYWAVFSLDLLMIVFWLASMGAMAAFRGEFQYSSDATCYDNGDTFGSGVCFRRRRRRSLDLDLVKRDPIYVANSVALAEMSGIAGLSALEMLLFVATFAVLAHRIRRLRRSEPKNIPGESQMHSFPANHSHRGFQQTQTSYAPQQPYDPPTAATAAAATIPTAATAATPTTTIMSPMSATTTTTSSYGGYPSQTVPVEVPTGQPVSKVEPVLHVQQQQQQQYAPQQQQQQQPYAQQPPAYPYPATTQAAPQAQPYYQQSYYPQQ